MKKSEIVRWVNREIAIAAEKGVHVHPSFVRVKKDGIVYLEKDFLNATGQGGNAFFDAVKKVFPHATVTDSGECGDVFRGKAAHFIALKMNLVQAEETSVPPELRARRDLYQTLRTIVRTGNALGIEVKKGGPVYSESVKELLKAVEALPGLKALPQHHNTPAKAEKGEEKPEKVRGKARGTPAAQH